MEMKSRILCILGKASTIGLPLSIPYGLIFKTQYKFSKTIFPSMCVQLINVHFCGTHCLFLHSPVNEHLGRLHFGYYKDVTINIVNILEIYSNI